MQLSIVSLVLLGVSLGLASPPGLNEVKLERGGCPLFWFSFNGRCYKYVSSHSSWADAELNCVSLNANLVSIHSLEEDNFVKTLIQNFDYRQGFTWIGLSDTQKERRWMWSDGCRVKYALWNSGQPDNANGNEHCVEINNGNQKKWNDRPCSATYPSVCASRLPVCPP